MSNSIKAAIHPRETYPVQGAHSRRAAGNQCSGESCTQNTLSASISGVIFFPATATDSSHAEGVLRLILRWSGNGLAGARVKRQCVYLLRLPAIWA